MRKKPSETRLITRRSLLNALSSSALVAATASYTLSYTWAKPANASSWEAPDDMAIGNPEAPVVVIEYFSLTCPHCWRFHRDTYAALRRDFVATGKVRYILRDYPLNEPALHAAVLAHCGGKERYFPFIETLFTLFEQWTSAEDYLAALAKIGELGQVPEAEFRACLNDKQIETRILKGMLEGEAKYGVESTPTFVINGKRHEGELSISTLSGILKAYLPKT
jgi:protein-disulfide isomerase